MRHTSLAAMPCPVARTLDVIGEWWTLLIVRDALLGARRFDDFKVTGIADNILAARLKRLVEEGVFERRPYQSRPERYEYLPTAKGRALVPVIAALRDWGQVWTEGEDRSPRLAHRACGHEVALSLYCEECGSPLTAAEIRPEPAGARGGAAAPTDRVDGRAERGDEEHP
jgi:DNA-binding HxlR family transcriptional regulator